MQPRTLRTIARPVVLQISACLSALALFHLVLIHSNSAVFAQDLDDVTISGRVLDQNGAGIAGAQVSVVHAATKFTRSVVADDVGRYRLVELAPGTYTVRAASDNFAAEERAGLETLAGQSVQLHFTLRPAGVVAEQIVVSETSGGAAVDTTRTVVGGTLTRAELETLPSPARSPLDFIYMLGGVSEEPLSTRDVAEDRNRTTARTPEEAGTFALSGGAAYSNNITIDGLDNNDDRAARERFQPSLEAVEEVQVITNQFSAEYGRASGGRVNLRTRGGAKNLHGRTFYFFRDEALNANSSFNNARGLKRLPLQEHNPGFTLSGQLKSPLKLFAARKQVGSQDDEHALSSDERPPANESREEPAASHFFFVANEWQTILDSTVVDTLVPVRANPRFPLPAPTTLAGLRTEAAPSASYTAAELAPYVEQVNTPLRAYNLTARTDHNFSGAHNATFLYQRGRSRNLRQFGGGLRLADALQGRTRHSDALAYTDNFVGSPRLVNQLRAQISRLTPALKTSNAQAAHPVVLINIDDPLAADETQDRSGTLVAGSSNAGASDRRETRVQLQNTLTVLRGAHTFKFGGDVQRISSTFIDLSDASGTFDFASAAEFLANAPARFRQRFNSKSVQQNLYTGFFAQVEWHARPNVTISYGLRYENETILKDRNNFAPRLALAYDPLRTGKTVIRLGAGLFYNRVLLRTVDDFTLGQERIFFDTDTLRNAATGKLLTDAERRAFIAANLSFPETLTIDSPVVKQFGALQTNFTRRLDPDLRIPESYQMNAGFERELARGFVVEANYTFNRGLHLWREFNANAPRLPHGYEDFAGYLLSRDFANFRDAAGTRPLYNTQSAGELVRFTLAAPDAANPDAIARVVEFGVPVTVFNLNSFSSGTALEAALAALNDLRPDPTRGQIEQLASIGNSFYHGLTVEARRRFNARERGFNLSLRAAYTLSRLTDDGVVNTSSALVVGDFRRERAPGLLDRRHRFVLSATLDTPRKLGGLRFSTILRLASGAPFNLSLGGADRNLDDVSNDRPNFDGDPRLIRSRRPGETLSAELASAFSLPVIGRTGNLPRNAGRGPAFFTFDLNITREFRFRERLRLRPTVEIDNPLNKTVHTFGAEFINFNALRPTATEQQRQSFLNSFLIPTHTLRPRSVRVGLRFDF